MRRNTFAALLVLCGLILSLASCGFLGELFATEFRGDIDVATVTKAGTYNVTAGFYVNDVWTIEAGSTFIMDPDTWIDVSSSGKIVAVGTSSKPIVFKSSKSVPARGDWNGVSDDGNGSSYVYCIFSDADTGLDINGSLARVENCTFRNDTEGLDLYDAPSMGSLSSNQFESNVDPLIVCGKYDLDDTNTFRDNTHQYVTLDSGTVTATRSWGVLSVPLYIDAGFRVEAILTIAAGTTLSMGPDTWIDVESSGSLRAVGTEAAPISFVSSKSTPAAGDWYGVTVDGNGSNLTWCTVSHAGTGVDLNSSSFTLEHSTLTGSATDLDYNDAGAWTLSGTNTVTLSSPDAP
ncbi:MAG TPA: hypothetical protein P5298_01360 [Spirochaetia bacterium]|nr:hypothetical protein [Spirochaetia bacterium]